MAILALGVAFVGNGVPAFALNNPVLKTTFPVDNTSVRSANASTIIAQYDRSLSLSASSFHLHDRTGAPVDGNVTLGPAPDPAEQPSSLDFIPANMLSENLSPYDADVVACPGVDDQGVGDCTHSAFSFIVDDTPPAPPSITSPAPNSVSQEQTATLVGTAEPGARISVVENDRQIASGQAEDAAHGGAFTIALPYPSEDGVFHSLSVVAIDHAGNNSPATQVSFWHDDLMQDTVITAPLNGGSVGSTTVTVAGVAKPNTTVRVYEGNTLVGTGAAGSDGRWSAIGTFSVATHTITATAFSPYETDGPSDPVTFTVDLTAPSAPVITTPAANASVGSNEVIIAGTAEPGASVAITEGAQPRATAPVDANGNWSTSAHFDDGAHTISAVAIDAAQNQSTPTTRSFTVDTVAPVAPVITTPPDTSWLNTAGVTIAGFGEPGATITVYDRFQQLTPTVTVAPNGSWTAFFTFADGPHTVIATATDAAGNVSPPSNARSFKVDTVPPSVPTILSPAANAVLTDGTVMVSGTSDPDTIVEIIDENLNVVGSIHATTHSTYSIPISFGNGAHTIVARAHDGAGNTSVSPGRSFTVNVPANAPNPPTFGAPLPNSAQPQAVTFSGTSDPGTEVYVYDGSTLLGSTAAPGGGWQLTANLTQGLHTNVHAHAVLNGVPGSDTYADPFTVDSTAPTIAVDTTLLPVYVSALSPDVTGEAHDDGPITAPPSVRGVVVQVYQYTSGAPVGNEVAAVCTGCGTQDASWSYTPGLPAGAYTVEVHSVDEVGNRSPGQRFTLVVV